MADIADVTAEREPLNLELSLLKSRRAPGPAPTGVCLWCEEEVGPDARWCDASCRNDWQDDQKRKGLQ